MRNSLSILALLIVSTAFADTIHLRNATFDPAVDVPQLDPAMIAKPTESPAYYLVSLGRSTTPQERNRLSNESGADIVAYVPGNTFVMLASGAEVRNLESRGYWVGRFEPAFKLANDIGFRQLFSETRRLERALGTVRFTVTLFDEADLEPASKAARAAGFDLISANRVGPRWMMDLRGPTFKAGALAHIESISFIEETSDRQFRNDVTRWVVQSNQTNVNSIWDRGIHGEGQTVGIIDTGVYRGHDMFRDPIDNTPGPNHRKLVYYSSSGGINSSSSHGTHTAGTLAGDQFPITGSTFRNGIAYAAKMAYTNLSDIGGSDLYPALIAHHGAGARVHSNSWGDDGTTQYTSDCQQIDQYSWDNETGMVAFAVTNTSLLKTPENAKSVLAVGATEQAPNQQSVGSGGAGPTSDGRRKPEIFAPGIGIVSARNGTTNQWRTLSGTSMACPAVTGAAALVRQYLNDGFFFGSNGARRDASGALLRAVLMNSSVDMTGEAGYPSNAEGWGRVLLANGMTFPGDPRRTLVLDIKNAFGFQANQATETIIAVTNSTDPLRVTMTFTDYPAQVFAGQAPVNDVDLEVVAPDGVTVYKGNVISNGQSSPGGNADAINSAEMVILPQPQVGNYRIRAIVRSVNQGAAQGMSIAINGRVTASISR
ncbi:MAG: S8 family serine peptidase [Fimbriimonadales bacterium]